MYLYKNDDGSDLGNFDFGNGGSLISDGGVAMGGDQTPIAPLDLSNWGNSDMNAPNTLDMSMAHTGTDDWISSIENSVNDTINNYESYDPNNNTKQNTGLLDTAIKGVTSIANSAISTGKKQNSATGGSANKAQTVVGNAASGNNNNIKPTNTLLYVSLGTVGLALIIGIVYFVKRKNK